MGNNMSEKQVGSKSNKTFMILSAFGIVMLLDAHTWTTVNIFANIIEYNSFFMPLFVFISGYFFSEGSLENIPGLVMKKTKKFMMPFLFWGFFYLGLERLMDHLGIIRYEQEVGIAEGLHRAFTTGQICNLAGPLWFLPASYFTQLIYAFVRRGFRKIWNEWLALLIFIIAGCASVSLSNSGWNTWQAGALLIPLKVAFFLQFYQLGVVYKKYLEEFHKKASNCVVLLSTIIGSIIVLAANGGNDSFIDLFAMTGFWNIKCVVFPLLTSVLGITFWLTVSRILEPAIGESKVVNKISDNTLGILEHHLFCYNVLNLLFWGISLLDKSGTIVFDVEMFQSWAVYRYEPFKQFGVFYIIVGIVGSLLIVSGTERIKKSLPGRKSEHNKLKKL